MHAACEGEASEPKLMLRHQGSGLSDDTMCAAAPLRNGTPRGRAVWGLVWMNAVCTWGPVVAAYREAPCEVAAAFMQPGDCLQGAQVLGLGGEDGHVHRNGVAEVFLSQQQVPPQHFHFDFEFRGLFGQGVLPLQAQAPLGVRKPMRLKHPFDNGVAWVLSAAGRRGTAEIGRHGVRRHLPLRAARQEARERLRGRARVIFIRAPDDACYRLSSVGLVLAVRII